MSPPKAKPDLKQRGIASFFGGGGGGAGAAKKAAAASTTTTAAAKASTEEADAAATVVEAKQREPATAASNKKGGGGDKDVIMVDSLDSDVKREVRRERAREKESERKRWEKESERKRWEKERWISTMRTLRLRLFVALRPFLISHLLIPPRNKTQQASPAPKKDADADKDEDPAQQPKKRLRKVADKEREATTASAEQPEAEEAATAAATKAAAAAPTPAAPPPRKAPSPSSFSDAAAAAAKGKGKATATTADNDNDDERGGGDAGEEEEEEEKVEGVGAEEERVEGVGAEEEERVEGVGAGSLAAAAAHAAADVPAAAATWPAGSPVPFEFLADVFESVADETKRLVIANRLATAFRAVLATTPGDLLPAVYLCVNRVAPAHAGVELGIGDATLIRALAEATGRSEAKVKLDLDSRGDLGVVAAEARASQKVMFKPRPLTVASVYSTFRDIASSSGAGSSERKRGLIKKLLSAAGRREAGYVVRGLQGKLRIGLAEQTVLAALAVAAELHHSPPPSALSASSTASKNQKLAEESLLANRLERAAQAVKRAYCECPSYDVIVPALVARPPARLHESARFVAGVPVKPMLAKPATGVSEVLDRAAGGELLAEYKYDGERAQVHVFYEEVPSAAAKKVGASSPSKATAAATTAAALATEAATAATTTSAPSSSPNLRRRVAIYSRNSEDNSGKYPDVAEAVLKALAPGVKELVLDAEVVAVDRASGKILPFQVLATRKRGSVTAAEVTVPVCLFAFDCLYKDGETMLRKPLSERREALVASLVEAPGEVQLAVGSRESGVEQLASFLDEAVIGGTEGLIVKTLNSTYEPSRRSTNWLKLKKVRRRRFFFLGLSTRTKKKESVERKKNSTVSFFIPVPLLKKKKNSKSTQQKQKKGLPGRRRGHLRRRRPRRLARPGQAHGRLRRVPARDL